MTESHHPLLKASEIEAALKPKPHPLKPEAVRISMCMSEAVGIKSLAVHRVRLDLHVESTKNHYHINEAEWIYITAGTGILKLIDASPTLFHPEETPLAGRLPLFPSIENLETEEREVGPGDFIGFEQGLEASKYSHSLKAGNEGLEYLVGGVKSQIDVCSYPELGRTMVFEEEKTGNIRVQQ
ncbi:hypothetical protein L204_100953 [Cryptococcus depauperatus]|nr:hypothetical protein L204_01114 [Cryptococcus depauperatus CBS 7855]